MAHDLLRAWADTDAVDHHCHPLRRWPGFITAFDLRAAFSESLDASVINAHTPCTAAYRSALRRLADEFSCAPSEEAILAVRSGQAPSTYANGLLWKSRTGTMLIDHGFGGADVFTPAEHRNEVLIPQREILRLETLAEALLTNCQAPGEWFEAVGEGLRSGVERGAVAVKTIAAYRGGLRLRRHPAADVSAAFHQAREQARQTDLRARLSGEALCHSLVFEAARHCLALGVPLQVHCGLGDPDEDLALAGPLGLRELIAAPPLAGLRIILLHCYPYHREAAYLCAVHPNVYMDLSLTIPLAASDGTQAMREVLGLCPWSKLLYGTDASRLPEAYFVAAALHREALEAALSDLVEARVLAWDEAVEAGRRVLKDNALSLYGLSEH